MTSMGLGDGGTFLGLDAEGLGAMIAIVSGAQTGTQLAAEPGTAGWTGRIREQECGVGGLATLFLGRAGVICLFVWLLGASRGSRRGRRGQLLSEEEGVVQIEMMGRCCGVRRARLGCIRERIGVGADEAFTAGIWGRARYCSRGPRGSIE
jgi:hypothetical protein